MDRSGSSRIVRRLMMLGCLLGKVVLGAIDIGILGGMHGGDFTLRRAGGGFWAGGRNRFGWEGRIL